MSIQESDKAISFKQWLREHGGSFHRHAIYTEAASGSSIFAEENIPTDEEIASCPYALAVSKTSCQTALCGILDLTGIQWSERQWISSYLCLHWIVGKNSDFSRYLIHWPYLETLPAPEQLLTALYFSSGEIEKIKGTNLFGATLDRSRQWREEWVQCQECIANQNERWGVLFTWEMYLAAATYLSSRAFPSSMLSPTPTLQTSGTTEPILLPGIDSLNHARGQPVSWLITPPKATAAETYIPKITLVVRKQTTAGQELLNNYGPKPNSELILGYGFSLPHNPDDTIILKVGGIHGRKWEIGRDAHGVDGLWNEILKTVASDSDSTVHYEIILDAASALREMLELFMKRLPSLDAVRRDIELRPQVVSMLQDYLEGQYDILRSLLNFANEREQHALELAREAGIELVIEDDP